MATAQPKVDSAIGTLRMLERCNEGIHASKHSERPPVVLVIDDEEAMRDSCAQVLAKEGFQVFTAPDGITALDMVAREKPDVMLVDLKMPGMPGNKFLTLARELDPELVAIAITGYPTLSAAIEVMKAGAYDFLPKPFKAEELRVVVGRALQKRRLAEIAAAAENERNRMRDNFVAMVSHQFKSPAASLKECLDAAISSYGSQIPPKCKDLLERAEHKAATLLDLMDDWLTLARMESGRLEEKTKIVDVREITRNAIAMVKDDPNSNDVAVEQRLPTIPLWVRGDAEALREMLVNLIGNAARYTPNGGNVSISVSQENNEVVIAISDTGPGIPAEEMGLIFEPFFRGEHAKQKPGTGLGLAIARQIARAHGGRIGVRSEVGKGTTFTVHLPQSGEEA